MMDIVLEEVREDPFQAVLHDARAPGQQHGDVEPRVRERFAQRDEALVRRVLLA